MWCSYLDSAAYGDWYWLHVIMVGKNNFFEQTNATNGLIKDHILQNKDQCYKMKSFCSNTKMKAVSTTATNTAAAAAVWRG